MRIPSYSKNGSFVLSSSSFSCYNELRDLRSTLVYVNDFLCWELMWFRAESGKFSVNFMSNYERDCANKSKNANFDGHFEFWGSCCDRRTQMMNRIQVIAETFISLTRRKFVTLANKSKNANFDGHF